MVHGKKKQTTQILFSQKFAQPRQPKRRVCMTSCVSLYVSPCVTRCACVRACALVYVRVCHDAYVSRCVRVLARVFLLG